MSSRDRFAQVLLQDHFDRLIEIAFEKQRTFAGEPVTQCSAAIGGLHVTHEAIVRNRCGGSVDGIETPADEFDDLL